MLSVILLRRETGCLFLRLQHNNLAVSPCRWAHGTNGQPSKISGKWFTEASIILLEKSEALLRNSYEKIGGLVRRFDDLLGISEVQEAQTCVKKAEGEFMKTRGEVQLAKTDLDSMQERLGEVRRKLDRVPRDDERYLTLATEEHKILVEEKKLRSEYERMEDLERDRFALLSGAVRDSHEKERARAERTKHWSVIGSVGGAALGILGSSVMNYVRLKQIKNSVKDTGNTLMTRTDQLSELIRAQDTQLETQTTQLQDSMSAQNQLLEQKLEELGNVLNFFTLNYLSEPLKDFGVQIPRPQAFAKGFQSGQPVIGQKQQQGITEDTLSSLTLRIDSIVEVMKINQFQIQGEFEALQQNMEKLDHSLLQKEELIAEHVRTLAKSIRSETAAISDDSVKQTAPNRIVGNSEWWAKASTVSSTLCGLLTVSVLLYEIFK